MHLLCRGSGSPVLFIHGMPTSSQLWSSVVDHLCPQFSCYAVDLPGLGKTPREPYLPNVLASWAERIDHLRAENGIEKWHVVGHDAGCGVAIHYAHSYDQHVDHLVLLSPAPFPDLKPYYLLELLRKRVLGELLAPVVSTLFWSIAMQKATRNYEGASTPVHSSFNGPFLGLNGSWEFMRTVRWGSPSEVFAEVPAFLPTIKSRTLIMHGSQDAAIPEAVARRASALIPNSQLVQVDCGHFIPLNRPVFLAESLKHFFAV